jgi:phosphopantothenoylcysteine decarboxylase/phosphopantothenate--cysteine ligase
VLRDKHILLGVTGGIAAYKVAYLVRDLVANGAEVRVVMTEAATKFVTPLTFSTLSGHEVALRMWNEDQSTDSEIGTRHIALATWADLMLIAPATANTIAKITSGMSDNLLTVLALACRAPLVLAPTMDADMYVNATTQENLAVLRERGVHVIAPGVGEHASGLHGPGRLPETEVIVRALDTLLDKGHEDLKGTAVLVTAGPTHEPIDPVRFVGNRSSGKMGFALARAAAQRGAEVTLVSGPVVLQTPRHVTRVDVETAAEMYEAVRLHAPGKDVVIMAAAVADFTPAETQSKKVKKSEGGTGLDLSMKPTADILKMLGSEMKPRVLVGFALETDNELEHAKAKRLSKNVDLMVLNSLKDEGAGFGTDTNVVTIVSSADAVETLPRMPKIDVADQILDRVLPLLT